jgi:hypothetical protein
MEYNKTLNQGGRTFSSPIVATKIAAHDENQEISNMIVNYTIAIVY